MRMKLLFYEKHCMPYVLTLDTHIKVCIKYTREIKNGVHVSDFDFRGPCKQVTYQISPQL